MLVISFHQQIVDSLIYIFFRIHLIALPLPRNLEVTLFSSPLPPPLFTRLPVTLHLIVQSGNNKN